MDTLGLGSSAFAGMVFNGFTYCTGCTSNGCLTLRWLWLGLGAILSVCLGDNDGLRGGNTTGRMVDLGDCNRGDMPLGDAVLLNRLLADSAIGSAGILGNNGKLCDSNICVCICFPIL